MARQYVIAFKNRGGHVYSNALVNCTHDVEAVRRASLMNVSTIGGFEVWDDERLVYSRPKVPQEKAE